MPERQKPETQSERSRFPNATPEERQQLAEIAMARAAESGRWDGVATILNSTNEMLDSYKLLDQNNVEHLVLATTALESFWNGVIIWAASPERPQVIAEALDLSSGDMNGLFTESGRGVPITFDRLTAITRRLRNNLEDISAKAP